MGFSRRAGLSSRVAMVTEAAPLVFRYSVRKYRVLPESRISSTMMMSRPLMSR